MQNPTQIQLEDSMLTSLIWEDHVLVLNIEADAHSSLDSEPCVQVFATRVVVSGATLIQAPTILPCKIVEAEIAFPKHSSHSVFLQLPFSFALPCKIVFVLNSGSELVVQGNACHVEIGSLIRTDQYTFEA